MKNFNQINISLDINRDAVAWPDTKRMGVTPASAQTPWLWSASTDTLAGNTFENSSEKPTANTFENSTERSQTPEPCDPPEVMTIAVPCDPPEYGANTQTNTATATATAVSPAEGTGAIKGAFHLIAAMSPEVIGYQTASSPWPAFDAQNNALQNLVQAMASFAPPAAGQTTLVQSVNSALLSVLVADWR